MLKGISFSVLLIYVHFVGIHSESTTPATGTTDDVTDIITDVTPEVTANDTATENDTARANIPSWSKCLAEGAGNNTIDDSTIVAVFLNWCRDYKRIIPCLETGIPQQAEDNALDFFISLTFNPRTLKKKSKDICRKISVVKSRILCAMNSSLDDAGKCTRRFSMSLRHIFAAYKAGVSKKELKALTCDLIHETTRCLDKTLNSCDETVKQFLLTYYALFTSKRCIYKTADPPVNDMAQEAITTRCAKESAKLAKIDKTVPATLREKVIKGIKTDCQTFEARFKCYERELVNATHFWDRWLRHTFELSNALEGHREMCARTDDIIKELTTDCFNQSQSSVMACENTFTAEADQIHHMEKDKNLTETYLGENSCRCTIEKAACYKKAFLPCSLNLGEMMSQNILSLLPTECREKVGTGSDVTDATAVKDTKAAPDTAAATEGKQTETNSTKDASAVNKASNLFSLLLITLAYSIT